MTDNNPKHLKWIDNKWTEVPAPPKPRITKDRFTFLWSCVSPLMFFMFIDASREADSGGLWRVFWYLFAMGWCVASVVYLVKLLFGKEMKL